ncbi:hypothetical protein [Flammeovirga sp. OC4]|uniref:hypothetical protein n=1 Tax=Flammeovirga sp. OC4 TaxID=1382345 RepID=UPI0005C655D5|nr:hypothetical protein [Flammeovirga sp. OC4]
MKNLLFTILLFSLFAFTSCISEKQLFIDDLKSEIPLDEEGRMNINVSYEGSKIIFELEPLDVPYSPSAHHFFGLFSDQSLMSKIDIGKDSPLYNAKYHFDRYEIRVKYTDQKLSTGERLLKFEEN